MGQRSVREASVRDLLRMQERLVDGSMPTLKSNGLSVPRRRALQSFPKDDRCWSPDLIKCRVYMGASPEALPFQRLVVSLLSSSALVVWVLS